MASGDERKELLAAVHEHLLQNGYQKAARELLLQSGQKTFPSCPVPLKDIFAQWKKTSSQTQKLGIPVKVRVPDPQSSSESSEEAAAAKPIKANLPVNNSSIAKAESSSEDEDSSSEEEAAPSKMVKAPLKENKASGCLQLAAQKSNSFPGKGVAVAAVQAKGQQNKAVSNKQPTPAAAKAGQNRNLFGKSALQSSVGAGQNTAQVKKKGADSESSSSSSSSESEEDKTKPVVKSLVPTPAVKKAESSSEDSSDSSEEETKVAAPQTKSAAPSAQANLIPAKGISDTAVPLKSNAGKALSAKKAGSQTTAQSGLAARSTKPTDSTESSSSSDSEAEKPPSVTQAKLPGKSTSTFLPAKSTSLSLPSNKSASVQSPLKPTPKPSVSNLSRLPLSAKSVGTTEKAGSSETSESSSESEDDSSSIPVSQKRLQAVHASSEAKESQTNKAGSPAKAASGALKGKKSESETSSSSDSEDETISASGNLPPPAATKGNASAQTKAQGPPGSLQRTQESEDSSQDSSDESESEQETVFTQKPSQLTQKPASIPAKTTVAKTVGATTKKAGGAQAKGKGRTKPAKPAGSLQNVSDSGTSDSSEDKGAAGKSVKQPPIHHFFQQKTVKATIASKKGIQANSNPPNSISSSCQSPSAGTTEKVEQSPSKKAKLSQEPHPPLLPAVIPKPLESSGSSSSSDSEEEPYVGTGAMQIPQPASTTISQKPGLVKKTESSSEESSGEDQEPSQSLLTGGSSQFKTQTSILAKNASIIRTSKSSGKASTSTAAPVIGSLVKSSGQTAASSSSSGSSDSDTDIEEMVGQQKDTGTLLPPEKETGGAKGAVASKLGLPSSGPKASLGKKASAKTQSNGKAKETPLALPSKEQVLPQVPGATTLSAAVKNPKNKKSSKKRKLGAEDGGLGEPKGKKLKEQHGPDMTKKLKKKKKDKTSEKMLKKKEGKSKKSDKKKKENKKLESSAADGSQKKKKKKKKKKAGDLGGAP